MNKKKLSVLTAGVALSICGFSETVNAAPSKILTFTNMPVWDYHKTNYDNQGNVRLKPEKTTFNLNGKEEKHSYIPHFNIGETEVKAPITIGCDLKTDEHKNWFENINKITKEDSTENPNLEQKLEFEKDGNNLIIKGNQRALDYNKLHNLKIYSKGHDSVTIPINIVQSKPINILVSYPMNPKTGEDVKFKLDNFNYAVLNPVNKVFLTHKNTRKELVKLEDYHVVSDLVTIYAKNTESEEGNLLEPGEYTLEVYADGFKKAEKKFEVLKNEIKDTGKNSSGKKSEHSPLVFKSTKSKSPSIDTISSASVNTGKPADNSGSGEVSGSAPVTQANLVYNHDLLANALILKEIGMETPESKNIVDRFELNTVSYDAVVSEDGTHINDFKDYLNAVKDASLAGKYLSFDEYIASKNAKEYKNRPYNVKEVLQDNLLGQATSFRDILGLKSPNLEVQTSIMNEDMVLKCDDDNYLNSIKAIAVNGDGREISKDLYSIEGDKLTINKKLTTGDKIKLTILATGYKDKVIESNLEKVLDKIDLKPEKEFKTGENVVITGLTHDFAKNIQSIKLDGKNLLTKEQGGYSSDTYYTISDDKLVFQSGLFKEAKQYNLEINGKYYGKKELSFNITESEKKPELDEKNPVEEKKELPKINLKVESKPGFMKKYEIKFRNSGDWINNVTNVSVNGTFYKSGLSWGETKERYAVYPVDELIGIGSDDFKVDTENTITVKAKGYDDFTFKLSKDGKIISSSDVDTNKDDTNLPEKTTDVDSNEVPQMKVTINKDSLFKKYNVKFENKSEEWLNKITKISVNGKEYGKGILWGSEKDHYSIQPIDHNIDIGFEGFKTDDDNVITISSSGYKDYLIKVSKDGNLIESKQVN